MSGGDAAADGAKDEGFIKAYLETILGNLQLSITNVHVRFEGELPALGSASGPARFAAGITLQELSATTTDASGAEAFEAKVRYSEPTSQHRRADAPPAAGPGVAAAQARYPQAPCHLL